MTCKIEPVESKQHIVVIGRSSRLSVSDKDHLVALLQKLKQDKSYTECADQVLITFNIRNISEVYIDMYMDFFEEAFQEVGITNRLKSWSCDHDYIFIGHQCRTNHDWKSQWKLTVNDFAA
ncbi:MAG: hypothetical protein U9Q15_03345 [Patescibacteria group bacterium]|nr:hypothetical protein [Patescibacteria group bacterium]